MPTTHKFEYLQDIDFKSKKGIKHQVFIQMQRDFALAEPFTISSASEQQLAYRWMLNREAYLVNTHVSRVLKDAIAFGISRANQCPFCAEGHEMMISASGLHKEANLLSLSKGDVNGRLFRIFDWAKHAVNPDSKVVKSPPFTLMEAPELIGTLFCFNVTNRLVNLFLGESSIPIPKERKLLRAIMSFMATRIMLKPLVSKKLKSGESLRLLPLPNENDTPKWAGEVENISIAYAAVIAHIKKLENELIPKSVVEKVNTVLENWDGQPWSSRGEWLNETVKGQDLSDQAITKLVLLVMFASYSVTEKDIDAFRKIHPGDKELIDFCYWAATKVTIRMLDWVAMPFMQ